MWEAQIKAALKAAGLDEALYSKITVTREVEIAGAVQKLQRELDSEKVIKVMEEAGLKDVFEKVLQSKVDQIVDKKLKAIDDTKKTQSDAEEAKRKAAEDNKKTEGMSDDQKLIHELREALSGITKEVQAIKAGNEKASRDNRVKAAMKAAGIPEALSKYVTGEDDSAIKEQIDGLKADMLTLKQAENDRALAEGRTPDTGTSGASATEAAIADFAKGRVTSNTGGGGLASQQLTKK